MKQLGVSFASGLLFALGLGVAGMTLPSKVLGFLDVAGHWNPSLAFVMGGAVLLGLGVVPRILRRGAPVLADRFHLPGRTAIDRRLLVGSAVFGLGWGLGGFCPGPALVSLATGAPGAVVFTLAMLAGMGVSMLWDARHHERPSMVPSETSPLDGGLST